MIKLRRRDDSGKITEWEVTYGELEMGLMLNKIDPLIEVWSDTLTQGQWKPVHELTLYKEFVGERQDKGEGKWTCGVCGRQCKGTNDRCWYCNMPKGSGQTAAAIEQSYTALGTLESDSQYSGYRRFSAGLFALLLLVFALPFVRLTCGGDEVARFSGYELAVGKTVETSSTGGHEQRTVRPNFLAILVIATAIAGLSLCVMSDRAGAVARTVASGIGILLLFVLSSSVTDEIAKEGGAYSRWNSLEATT